ncbi:hypothetical protein BJV78DRAFT_1284459 [Lactifluus subvellereus]|nr:hypothetical protein BJV78DRAFT_1284459 [Lactifluus subvellereus]
MNSLSTSQFDGSSFLSAPSSASSTVTGSQFPYITSTQVPASICSSTDASWFGAGSSSLQSSPSPTNIVPGFATEQETRAEVSFQTSHQCNLNLSAPAGSPPINPQPQEFINLYSQCPSSVCIDLKPVLTERKPQRPCNAFMLFRSDLLKRGLIPKDQETRQHKLSIIAGKCWHKLTKEEKKKWFLQVEREKKASAIKYGGNQSRARAKTRREPKHAPKAEELEHLDRLADIAYQEITSGTSSQPAAGNTTSSAITTSPFQLDKIELPLLIGGSQEQAESSHHPPFSSPAGAASVSVQSFQIPQITPTRNTLQNGGMFRGTAYRLASASMRPPVGSLTGTTARLRTAFPPRTASQNSTLAPAPTMNPFTIPDGGARLAHVAIEAPVPASLARNPFANV